MLDVRPIPAFQDNYIWLIRGVEDPATVAVVDPGDADPVLTRLEADGLKLAAILATHHHADHVGGAQELVEATGCPVFGPARERLPIAVTPLRRGDRARLPALGIEFEVLDVPGHTAGHIAYYGHGALFCGDTLFSAGCGRLFEGTPAQMHASLAKLAALPDDTLVYCTHEYTLSNLRFARAADPDNEAVAERERTTHEALDANRPSLPSTIGLEKAANPFLRAHIPALARTAGAFAGRSLAEPVEVFAALRKWKDNF